MSAFLVSVCTSPPSAGYMAMPMLAVVWHSWPLNCTGWLSMASRLPAMRFDVIACRHVCSRMTTNSSPPSRATTSLARKAPRSRSAISTSSMSPASCPSESLMTLNRSRSMNSTANRRW